MPNIPHSISFKVYTKYENLIKESFSLFEEDIVDKFVDINKSRRFGIKREWDLGGINKFHQFVYYMALTRVGIDKELTDKGNQPLTPAEFEDLKERYHINELLKERVCLQYTERIINIFLRDIPLTTDVFTFRWSDTLQNCVNNDTQVSRNQIQKIKNNEVVVDFWFIVEGASVQRIQDVTGASFEQATELFASRIVDDTEFFCCSEETLEDISIVVEQNDEDEIRFSWNKVGDVGQTYQVILAEGTLDNVIYEAQADTFDAASRGGLAYTSPIPNTVYFLSVVAENCAGQSIAALQITNPPIIINIGIAPPNDESELQLVDAQYGDNIGVFGQDFVFGFSDPAIPLYKVTSVLIDGVESIGSVMFTDFLGTEPIAGIITIPSLMNSTDVVITIEEIQTCDEIVMDYSSANCSVSIDILP